MGEGDEIREYTHTPTPKLHATVSVAEQIPTLYMQFEYCWLHPHMV